MSTVYAGRTVDLNILSTPRATGQVQVDLAFGNPAKVCTGIQKVAQTFVSLLLASNVPQNDYTFGSSFIPAVRSGVITNDSLVEFYFNLAVSEILNYLNEDLDPDTPEDERLTGAELASFDLQPGFLTLTIDIFSAAGENRQIITPIPLALR